MHVFRTRFMLALAASLASCTSPSSAPDPAELMEADRAFAAAVVQRGSAAWVEWFAADGAMVQPGVGEIRGRESIRSFASFLDTPGTSLLWSPARADIAASGDLGWTTGRYVMEAIGPDGSRRTDQGVYVSIWRRQDDGSWRVVMDLGNPTEGPEGG